MNTTFKYMTFNSSCSYAGLANMLLRYGVDTQDREIARDMKLPFLFAYEEDEYRAGPMLQGAQWFNLYLHPRGLEMRETEVPAQSVAAYLRRQRTAMLGIRGIENGKALFKKFCKRDFCDEVRDFKIPEPEAVAS